MSRPAPPGLVARSDLAEVYEPEDAAEIEAMFDEAVDFIQSHDWAPPIDDIRIAYGIGGVIAVFFVRLREPIADDDDALWVIVGDLPSAFMVTDDISNAPDALQAYCELMDDWVAAVLHGHSLDQVFPVRAAPTRDHAEMLASRMRFIREEIIPDAELPP